MSLEFLTPVGGAAPLRDPFQTATVSCADRSDLTVLELQAPAPRLRELIAHEPGLAQRDGESWSCPVRPGVSLQLLPPGSGGERRAELESAGVRTTDLSAALGAISVAGPWARETIARFCALDTRAGKLPVGGFRPGSIARTPGYLLREDDGFLLLFGTAFGAYLWEVVIDAAAQLGERVAAPRESVASNA